MIPFGDTNTHAQAWVDGVPQDSDAKGVVNETCQDSSPTTQVNMMHAEDNETLPTLPTPAPEQVRPPQRYNRQTYKYPGQSIDLAVNGIHLEELEDYRPGGYHPVHIHDILDGRYEVAHKLGAGGYATVWLCRDTDLKCWNAVKIVVADKSSETCQEIQFRSTLGDSHHAVLPESHFWIEGPNGRHLALVMPVLGPSISAARDLVTDDATLRKICRRMAEALHYFHDNEICHGDFRPSNILHRMHSINSLTKHQIWRLLGSPFSSEYYSPVTGKDGSEPGPHAPRYAIRTADMRRLQDWIITDDIAVVDFGVAFETSDPPQGSTGIPPSYSAPELLFEGCPSPSSDVWALACSILCLYTGEPLGALVHDAISDMELYFGPLPERYRQAYDRLYKENGTDDESDDGSECEDPYPEPMDYSGCTWPVIPIDEAAKGYLVWEEREIQEKMKTAQSEDGYTDIFNAAIGEPRKLGGFGPSQEREYRMPRHEVLQLTDLLRPMFHYEEDERPDTTEILEHPWFATT
ncbi:kinase-like domain-containing protein [Hypoxylon rubiginosum]|uniref:Kinase-like domain-containing protein n=1 Tax=Hypoxylon rubiginosum TaxID=110542 RepID=A0ACB9YJ63_9PEZI|nr:kinase-like domain-containing protein [Hypoxylon rubiginosum]